MTSSRLGGFFAALLVATATSMSAQAATVVGTFSGNDPFGGQTKGLYGTFGNTEISSPSLAKCDAIRNGAGGCDWENGAVAGQDYTKAFDISFAPGGKSGTWAFTAFSDGDPLTHLPAYMVVKAATTWVLYSLDGALSGNWSTAGIVNGGGKQPGISHLSFYNSAAPIPLPAAAWLLIAGLGALGAVARRRG